MSGETSASPSVGVSAEAAIKRFALDHSQAIGWVLSPMEAYWVRLDDGSLTRHGDSSVDLDRAFEVRLFDSKAELRWWWVPELESGRCAIWSDTSVPDGLMPMNDHEYQLLWGQVVNSEDEWVRLDDARIGTMWVPYDEAATAKPGELARLRGQPYEKAFRYGNVVTVDTRLKGLEIVTAQSLSDVCREFRED